jgi:hypothetical protein
MGPLMVNVEREDLDRAPDLPSSAKALVIPE